MTPVLPLRLETARPARVDRYQDWLRRMLPESRQSKDDQFCVTMVRLPCAASQFLNAAEGLSLEISSPGPAPQDALSSADFRITPDENRALQDTIEVAENNPSASLSDYERLYLLFMRESEIYCDGDFKSYSFMEIIYASPPLDGFEKIPRDGEPTLVPAVEPASVRFSPVAMAIVDDTIAFAHERFRNADGSTRFLNFWAQNYDDRDATGRPLRPYGLVLDRHDINELLQRARAEGWSERRLYHEAGALDLSDPNAYAPLARRLGHGTHVLDLAAGADPTKAPIDRPLFAVQLRAEASQDTSGMTLAAFLIHGLMELFRWADNPGRGKDKPAAVPDAALPLVITFSYGILAGLKDGSHIIERLLDEMIEARSAKRKKTAMVLPAGNSYRSRTTARVSLNNKGERDRLGWLIQPEDRTASFAEIWVRDDADPLPLKITLEAPGGVADPIVAPAVGCVTMAKTPGNPIAAAYTDLFHDRDGQPVFRVLLAVAPTRVANEGTPNWHPASCGRWLITLENTAEYTVAADIHIQRDDTPLGFPRAGRQSWLDHPRAYEFDEERRDYGGLHPDGPISHANSLSAIATGKATTVVGAALVDDSLEPSELEPADYTAEAGTDATSPDGSAIADAGYAMPGVLAAGTASGTAIAMGGTSVAAPQFARVLANEMVDATNTSGPVPADLRRLGERVVNERRTDIPCRRRL